MVLVRIMTSSPDFRLMTLAPPLNGAANGMSACFGGLSGLEERIERLAKVVPGDGGRLLPVIVNLSCIAKPAGRIVHEQVRSMCRSIRPGDLL